MKKIYILSFALIVLSISSCSNQKNESLQVPQPELQQQRITAKMALEGVNNYCHKQYDWSVARNNPDMMYVKMGDETETEYQVIFRSYTGTLVYFHVDKASGTTRMVEHVPTLGVEDEAGTFNLHDYLKQADDSAD